MEVSTVETMQQAAQQRVKGTTTISILALSALLSACSLAPGIYSDKINLESSSQPHQTEQLGGQLTIIPMTVELAERKAVEREVALEARRKASHELMLSEQQRGEYNYRVAPHDVLNIMVWGHPEFNVTHTSTKPGLQPQAISGMAQSMTQAAIATGHEVDADGYVFFPYIGRVRVAGKTLSQIRALLTRRLAGHIRKPQLDVGVAAYLSQQVYVVGEVRKPHAIQVNSVPLEVIDAVTHAGGFTESADTRNVSLIRDGTKYHIDVEAIYEHGDLTQNYVLQHGDVLRFPDNRLNSVYAVGAFTNNRRVVLPPRLFTLADLIEDPTVRGFDMRSVNTAQVLVLRYDDRNRPEAYHLDTSSAEGMMVATRFPLLPRDVVYADTSPVARWRRVIDNLRPAVGLINDGTGSLENLTGAIEDLRN